MKKSTTVAFSAAGAALAVVFYLIAGLTGRFTLTLGTAASIAITTPLMLKGVKTGMLAYIASAILLAILVPYQAFLFAVFFGIYPVLNFLINKMKNKLFVYTVKGIYFTVLLIGIYFASGVFFNLAILDNIIEKGWIYYLIPFGIAALYAYDYLWNKLIIIVSAKLKKTGI
jgi:hypothetical protein